MVILRAALMVSNRDSYKNEPQIFYMSLHGGLLCFPVNPHVDSNNLRASHHVEHANHHVEIYMMICVLYNVTL